MPVRGVIFDYGGTLDSGGDHWSEVILEAWRNAGLETPRDTFREAYVYAERLLARTPVVDPDDDFETLMLKKVRAELEWLADNGGLEHDRIEHYVGRIAHLCDISARRHIEDARPVLERVHASLPMVLVSNFYGNVRSVLRGYGLERYFADVVESAVAGVRKPDPAIFALGVKALGLYPAEVLVVGDSLRKDILPAESLGCRTAWLKGRGWTPEEDAASHQSLIGSLSDILPLLGLEPL